MRRQQRAASYGASPVFVDGMVMRAPPVGALSREELQLGDDIVTGKQRGKYLSQIPVSLTSDQLHMGDVDFRVYCGVCHGPDGSGRSVVASNMRPIAPPSLLTESARRLTEGELFDILSHGRGRMPSYDWALPPVERWAVIATLRSLQRRP